MYDTLYVGMKCFNITGVILFQAYNNTAMHSVTPQVSMHECNYNIIVCTCILTSGMYGMRYTPDYFNRKYILYRLNSLIVKHTYLYMVTSCHRHLAFACMLV